MTPRMTPRLAPAIILLSLLFAPEARAQFGAIGAKGGVNWTDLSLDTPTEGGSGFLGGLFAYGQSGSIVAQFEVLLSKRSFSGEAAEVSEDFIQVPALFGARGGTGTVNAMLYAGPCLSFKTSCKTTGTAGVEESCRSAGLLDKGTLWSLIVGLAIDFQFDRVVFILDGRYDNGLTNAFENRDGKWRSWAFMAGIGFLMPT